MINPLLLSDGYKIDHRRQYPNGTTLVYSNWTPRKSRMKDVDSIVVFGIQYFIKKYLIQEFNDNFFNKPVDEVIKKYTRRINNYLGPNSIGDQHLRDLHELGYLPLYIKALPEGSVSPIKVPVLTMYNTKPEFFWLTNYIETLASCVLWQPMTSATIAREYRAIFDYWAMVTGGDKSFVQWQGHDFSMRGMSSPESAMISSAAHLLSFTGTDTVPAIDLLEEYYDANSDAELIGGSVAATEHSVMCAGSKEGEFETFKRLITEIYPTGIISIVSDTWDLWTVLGSYLPQLKDIILARDGKVVIRPDSGDPVDIIAGYKINDDKCLKTESDIKAYYQDIDPDVFEIESDSYKNTYEEYCRTSDGKIYHVTVKASIGKVHDSNDNDHYCFDDIESVNYKEVNSLEVIGVVETLWNIFGGTEVEGADGKIYKVLDPHIGDIYGDSITLDRANEICERLAAKGFASTNWAAGIGSYTYQYNTRDTFGFAMKATYVEVFVDGEGIDRREIFKNPSTDKGGEKKSAKGLLAVYKDEVGNYFLQDQVTWAMEENSELLPVFINGKLVNNYTLEDIRKTLAENK